MVIIWNQPNQCEMHLMRYKYQQKNIHLTSKNLPFKALCGIWVSDEKKREEN